MASAFVVAGIIRQYFVPEIEGEHAAQQLAIGASDCQHLAIVAKNLEQSFEITLGHGGCAMTMHVVGKELEEPVCVAVDCANEAILDALANHGALLARDGQHVGLDVGQDFLAKGDV